MTGKPTLLDELMAYIAVERRCGPVFGYAFEAIAHTRWGRTPGTVTARLRELEKAGWIGKEHVESKTETGRKTKFVMYRCTVTQYSAWQSAREDLTAQAVVDAGFKRLQADAEAPSTPTGSVVDGNPPSRSPSKVDPAGRGVRVDTRPGGVADVSSTDPAGVEGKAEGQCLLAGGDWARPADHQQGGEVT